MGINKVIYNGGTLIDLTGDTVTSSSLMEGYTAHDRTGEIIIGTASGGSGDGYVWQDGEGYVHLSDEEGTQTTIDALEVNASGTYTAPSGHAYSPVTVPSGTEGTPTATKGTVSNHSVSITPSVTNSGGYISGGTHNGTAVSVSASELVSGTLSVTSSGTKNVTNYASASIPSGTEGTPTATKGTVSNHSISITPSVTNSSGFISGGTHSGTAVSVSASELVSGTKSISENGTGIDVTNYASVDVSVPTGGGGGGDTSDLKAIIERTATNPTLPSDLTSIGNYAFYHYTNLALTSLPSGVVSIGDYAFYVCDNLALTSLPSGVTSIGGYAFYNCTNLALTELPSGVTAIGPQTFYNCTNLALTSLPSGVTAINQYGFYQCKKLSLTSLPDSVKTIAPNAFNRCSGLESISCDGIITTLDANSFLGSSSYQMQLKSVSFPNMALTSNLSTAFGSTTVANACQQLEFADIGSTTGIASNAFANCYKLQTLVLRKSTVCILSNVSAFFNTPMRGYNSLTGTVYVPSDLISSYQTASNWSTLYNNGTVTFVAIEGSEYER